ncbi:hypothetical protein DRV85_12625 [Rhodosalinus halophilus]|uniref:Uncharacterized protein n=2 Tax=Rhodosalinus halophilus TaxID=2259333 RepID=A0A365U6V2_9RHOB|nr:hypothetical protein DRV85_12625 [Rhodosalinus halophilus]
MVRGSSQDAWHDESTARGAPRLGRFDPVCCEGAASARANGSRSSKVFTNSDGQAHGRTGHAGGDCRRHRERGQRRDRPHLSDDRIINRTTFLTAGFSVSVPGEGIAGAFAGGVPNWTGGFINVVVNF